MDSAVQGRFWGQHGDMETRWAGANLALDWGTTSSLTSATGFQADHWYFVAIIWDETANTLLLYTGDQATEPTLDANSLNGTWLSTTPLPTENRFLNGLGGNEPVDGHGDELRYWNTTRTLTALQSDYNVTLMGSEPGLRSYYPLDASFDDVGPANTDGASSGSTEYSVDVSFSTLSTEDLQVEVWTGLAWQTLSQALTAGWNNVTVTSYLTSSTLTIRYHGGTETNDMSQDSWQIAAALLHVWS